MAPRTRIRLLKLASFAALAGAALLLAACGGSEDGGKGGNASYIEKAEAACKQDDKEAKSVPPLAANATPQQLSAFLANDARLREQALARFDKIAPPPSLAEQANRYLELSRGIVADQKVNADLAAKSDALQQSLDARIGRSLTERARVAAEIGFKVCGGAAQANGQDDQLIAKADPICEAANEAISPGKGGVGIDAYGSPAYNSDPFEAAKQYGRALDATKQAIGELRASEPKQARAKDYAKFLKLFEKRTGLVERKRAAAEAGDDEKLKAVMVEDRASQLDEYTSANRLGFKVCGQYGAAGV